MLPFTVALDQPGRIATFSEIFVVNVRGRTDIASIRISNNAIYQAAFTSFRYAAEHLAAIAASLRGGRHDRFAVAEQATGRSSRLLGASEKATRRLDRRWVGAKAEHIAEDSHS